MSNLKYLSLDELYEAEKNTGRLINYRIKNIAQLEKSLKYQKSSLSGQRERLKWIRKYIAMAKKDGPPTFLGEGI